MRWLEKYRPKTWEEYDAHTNVKKAMEEWIEQVFSKKSDTFFLYLCGPAGTGKTSLARLLLEKYKLDIIEWNAIELKQTKILEDILTKTLFKDNIQILIYEKKVVSGLILEECDCLQNVGKEILSRVTENMRNIEYRTPVICTSNELECDAIKNAKMIEVPPVESNYIRNLTAKICQLEHWNLGSEIIDILQGFSDNDIRSWIVQLENIYTFFKSKGLQNNITQQHIESYLSSTHGKDKDMTLYQITRSIFSKNVDVNYVDNFYDESIILPMMVYSNVEYTCDNTEFLKTKQKISGSYVQHEILRDFNKRIALDEFHHYSAFLSLGIIQVMSKSPNTLVACRDAITFPTNIYNKKYTECTHRKLLNQMMYTFNLTRTEVDYWSYFLYAVFRNCQQKDTLQGLLELFDEFFGEKLDEDKLKDLFKCDYLRPELKKRKKEAVFKILQSLLRVSETDKNEKKRRGRPRKISQPL